MNGLTGHCNGDYPIVGDVNINQYTKYNLCRTGKIPSIHSAFSLIADRDLELDSAIPPGAIVDLEIAGVSRSLGRILLTWTAVGANGESPFTKVDKYEVCSVWNPFKLWAQREGCPVGRRKFPCLYTRIILFKNLVYKSF